ncbi:MAG: ABC transporter ATP-binding protein [Candidatus Rokubacteria bacterium]|nr:ABC transporter ATP-binding protein [Candidatus Rokubacteria bacterium]
MESQYPHVVSPSRLHRTALTCTPECPRTGSRGNPGQLSVPDPPPAAVVQSSATETGAHAGGVGGRPKLQVQGVHINFGGVKALQGVSLDLLDREILAIIGPNGAGKTTLINSVSGVYHPSPGRIVLDGENITYHSPARIAALGVARTFQNVALFKGMTVLENLLVGRHLHMRSGALASGLYWQLAQREEIRHRAVVERLIDFLEITHIRNALAGTLPYGLQKRVELGRALAMEPRVLLLDEPMAGMNMEEKEDMARFILDVNDEWGFPTILIEHDMGVVMDISNRVVVLDHGEKIAEGSPGHVRGDPLVISAYLGEEAAA